MTVTFDIERTSPQAKDCARQYSPRFGTTASPTGFKFLRKIPTGQTPKLPIYWFEELSVFNCNMKGETK